MSRMLHTLGLLPFNIREVSSTSSHAGRNSQLWGRENGGGAWLNTTRPHDLFIQRIHARTIKAGDELRICKEISYQGRHFTFDEMTRSAIRQETQTTHPGLTSEQLQCYPPLRDGNQPTPPCERMHCDSYPPTPEQHSGRACWKDE